MNKGSKWLGTGGMVFLLLTVVACAPAAVPTPTPTKAAAPTAAPTAPPATKPPAAAPTPTTKPAAAQPTAKPAPVTIRYGAAGSAADGAIYIAMERGYFTEQGIDWQWQPFQSGAMVIAPISSGDIDIGGGGISTGLLNAIDRGVALKVVADKGSNVKGFDFVRVTVRKDLVDSGQVKEVKDLKGKKFAVASTKSSPEAIVHFLLKQGGLTIKDVELVALGYADMLAAYANKAIDAAMQIEPTLNAGVERGLAVRWAPGSTSTIYGGEYQGAVLLFSEPFSKKQDAARRFMVAYLKGMRDYNDAFVKGKNKDAAISILTKYTAEKDPAPYANMEMPYLNPDGKMHVPSMKMDLDYFKEMGYYTGKVELPSIIDTQFIDYAAQQLGPYK